MKNLKTFFKYTLAVVFTLLICFLVITNYSWIFSKSVEGVVYKVERVTDPTMLVGSATVTANVMHSFAVAIKADDGAIYTASSEDRQWAVVRPGCRVRALYFRYPFWELQKTGTFFNARLDDMRDCPSEAGDVAPTPAPAVAPAPAPAPSDVQ